MRLPLIAAAAVLVLAACKPAGEAAPADDKAGPPSAPQGTVNVRPELNGVDLTEDLRMLGTEPFWSIEAKGLELKFTGADLPERTAPDPGPDMILDEAVWRATTSDGAALKITLTAGPCSDGMSDRTYPLSAKVELGSDKYTGCAATIAALDRARGQESGEIR